MYRKVESKLFLEQLRKHTDVSIQDIKKAVKRVMTNPTLHSYMRSYLTPHCQEHPSRKIYTIFFEVITPDIVFFVWVNDDSCLHDTHKNFGEDPCVKEFKRLKAANHIETFSSNFHDGVFDVKPRQGKPSFISFEKFGIKVFSPIYNNGTTNYTLSITTHAQESEIFDHYKIFLEKLHEHFTSENESFEIRVLKSDTELKSLIEKNIDPAKWKKQVHAGGDIIWSK